MNQGPAGYEPDALTAELEAHIFDHPPPQQSYPRRHMMIRWSGWQDLNPRPTGPKPVALPNCATPRYELCKIGRGRRIRTLDTRFWRPLLYQLSYTPMKWRRRRDSNSRGPDTNPNGLANRPLQPLEYFSKPQGLSHPRRSFRSAGA